MSMTLKLECDGQCGAFIETERFRRWFRSFDGKGWGWGVWEETEVKDLIPEGWQGLDPYTGMTYCPTCWAEIIGDENAA